MSERVFNLTVLISGYGSNLQALIDACGTEALPNARIAHVISNKKAAYGLERAKKANIDVTYHNLLAYKKKHANTPEGVATARAEYDAKLATIILDHDMRPDLVVCAGWMHIVSPSFLAPIAASNLKIINLHPALPGEFAGANAIDRAWEAGHKGEIKRTGVMIHEVIEEVDAGKTILSKEVEIKQGESLEELEERIHAVEHGLIVEGTRKTLEGLGR